MKTFFWNWFKLGSISTHFDRLGPEKLTCGTLDRVQAGWTDIFHFETAKPISKKTCTISLEHNFDSTLVDFIAHCLEVMFEFGYPTANVIGNQ